MVTVAYRCPGGHLQSVPRNYAKAQWDGVSARPALMRAEDRSWRRAGVIMATLEMRMDAPLAARAREVRAADALVQCPTCSRSVFRADVEARAGCCPECGAEVRL